jgi:hypothetical protein
MVGGLNEAAEAAFVAFCKVRPWVHPSADLERMFIAGFRTAIEAAADCPGDPPAPSFDPAQDPRDRIADIARGEPGLTHSGAVARYLSERWAFERASFVASPGGTAGVTCGKLWCLRERGHAGDCGAGPRCGKVFQLSTGLCWVCDLPADHGGPCHGRIPF